jgi:predicted nucleic acid-binding protein
MVIVDTSVWIDYLRNTNTVHTQWLDVNLNIQRLGLTDLILCEVLQGISQERQAQRVEQELTKFAIFNNSNPLIAVAAAKNYRLLRNKGRTVRKTIDCLIATFCLVNDFSLLHTDNDFAAFEGHFGLRVIHP